MFEDQSPSAAADCTLPPVASMNTPSVPASVGPYDEDPHTIASVAFVVALIDTTLRPFAGSRIPAPELPGAMNEMDQGIALANPSNVAVL